MFRMKYENKQFMILWNYSKYIAKKVSAVFVAIFISKSIDDISRDAQKVSVLLTTLRGNENVIKVCWEKYAFFAAYSAFFQNVKELSKLTNFDQLLPHIRFMLCFLWLAVWINVLMLNPGACSIVDIKKNRNQIKLD